MIEQSKYVPRQMNGPVINAFEQALEADTAESKRIMDYLYGLSIATSEEEECETIGKLIGYPRPLTPEGFNADKIFLMGTEPISQDPQTGYSDTRGEIGGQLTSIYTGASSSYMSLPLYKKLIEKIAVIKRRGITIKSVEDIAMQISDRFTLGWNEDGDIIINFQDSIGFKNVWALTQLFYRFCTEPQVIIQSGGN